MGGMQVLEWAAKFNKKINAAIQLQLHTGILHKILLFMKLVDKQLWRILFGIKGNYYKKKIPKGVVSCKNDSSYYIFCQNSFTKKIWKKSSK